MTIDDVFDHISPLKRWVPFKLVFNPKRGKHDKVPDNGRHGLSTADPMDWRPLLEAIKTAKEGFGLSGVGLVMTGGIEVDGFTLVGFDFDGIDEDKFELPFETYTEWSPSGKGARAFAWAPSSWCKQFQDSADTHPPFCEHAEIYIGTAPRFLTVTFNVIQQLEFKELDDDDLKAIVSWGMKLHIEKVEAPIAPDTAGKPVDFARVRLTDDQKQLVDGTFKGDKSKTMQGLIIRLMDSGLSNEDIFATLVRTPNLWAYLLSHRSEDETKALKFAHDEITKAYALSMRGKREALTAYNENWKPTTNAVSKDSETVVYPAPFPGVMSEAVTAALEVAHKPQPQLAMLSVLIASAALCGSFYALASGCRLNLYGIGVLPTAGGKNQPQQQTKKFAALGNVKIISAPASGEALEDDLLSHIGTYCVVDEIGHLLALTNARDAKPWHVSLMRKILDLYAAGADDNYYQRGKAGKPGRAIPNPALNIIGFTTPGVLAQALTLADIENGLYGRLLWVVSDDIPKNRRIRKPFVMPKSFSSAATRIKVNLASSNLANGAPVLVDIHPNADALLDTLNDEFDLIGRGVGAPHERALCARSLENVEHISGVLAVLNDPDKPVITTAHVEWAAQFVRASNKAVLGYVESELHSGGEQKNAALLLKMIGDGETKPRSTSEVAACKAGWTPRSALLRRSKMGADREFEPAIRLLVKRGEVVEWEFGASKLQVLRLKGDDE
ncbi:DUF3987 domain-containing protein [Pseudomonas sp. GD03862]|uniref:DUF3987 domain-containing protein n=1 Tax=Pseudomonas sp. GD03862 TaxID=2975391 RepID=UPI00244B9C90|nr:DUF3987 domain-containing protein [Pseudomonas sp. GD03862]MDH0707044.1 DUF3987 domain-containing protein [Pseudomonas sp. GD03862]